MGAHLSRSLLRASSMKLSDRKAPSDLADDLSRRLSILRRHIARTLAMELYESIVGATPYGGQPLNMAIAY